MSVPPLIGSGFVIVRTTDTRVTAFDAVTGERRWHYQSQVPALTVRAPAQMRFSPAGVLVGQANGRLLALNARGETVFDAVIAQPKGTTEVERLVDVVGAPMVDARMMCAAALQGNLVCRSSLNGRRVWNPAVDAVTGPVSYDIASLMRDAFVSWGEEFVLDVTIRYWDKARRAEIPVPRDFGVYWRDIEWMGLQRHLKILGIFARLNYRDGKPKYLADTPRFIHYVRQTANRYDELKAINWLLDCFEDSSTQEAYF